MATLSHLFSIVSISLTVVTGGTLSPKEQQSISWEQSYNAVGLIPTDGIEDPLPACGEFINSQTWGPITNATVWDSVCNDQGGSEDGKSYRAHNP
ncbi:MAG: hypothetical protein JNM28_08885 [Armatimonadetes bacterium]|nr:hypothetical protein [Armatimonadota bacterium]